MAPKQPNSLAANVTSLIKTCTEISQSLGSLKNKLEPGRIAISLLSVECSTTSWGLSQLEKALLSKPNSPGIQSDFESEENIYLENCVVDVALVFDHLNEELGLMKEGLSKEGTLDSDESSRYEDRLRDFVQRIRDQGLSISFLLACVQVNCDLETEVYGISSVAKSIQQNHTKSKSRHSTSKIEEEVQGDTEIVPAPRVKSHIVVDKPPRPDPVKKAKRKSADKRKNKRETLLDEFKRSGSSSVPTIDEKESNELETIIDIPIPKPKQLSGQLLDLHKAIEAGIRSGNTMNVKTLLEEAVDTGCIPLSELESGDCSFLGEAIKAGSTQIIQLLLEYGVDIEGTAVHSVGYGALHWATSRNQIDSVRTLLQEGINVTTPTATLNETALLIACRKGLLEIMKLLLRSNGASVLDTVDRENKTPLQAATSQGYLEIVEVLLEAGANVHLLNRDGHTPLHVAAEKGYEAIARSLIKHQASIDAKDLKNKTALHLATAGGHVTIVELLMEYGTELDALDSGKKTPLHLAARNGHYAAAELMIEYGANLEAKDEDEWTPLHFATYNKRHDIINLLLDSGALVDSKSSTGQTCLMRAAELDDPISITALCKHGADPNLTNNTSGFTAIHFAAHEGSINALKTLMSLDPDLEKETSNGSTPLIIAAWRGQVEIIKILLSANANIHHQRSHKITALRDAASSGHVPVCEFLLSHGALIDSRDDDNETPLMVASTNAKITVIKLLLEKGASIDAKDDNSHSALYSAAHNGHVDAVEVLLDAGASINIETNLNATPFHIAAYKGHLDVVRLLLSRGAEREGVARHKNVKGTVVEVARLAGHKEVVELIERWESEGLERNFVADERGGVWDRGSRGRIEGWREGVVGIGFGEKGGGVKGSR